MLVNLDREDCLVLEESPTGRERNKSLLTQTNCSMMTIFMYNEYNEDIEINT